MNNYKYSRKKYESLKRNNNHQYNQYINIYYT